MIRRSLLTLLMAAALTACAPSLAAPPPTINPTDIGATALALANSMLTQTPQFGGLSVPPYVGATASTVGTPVPVTGLSAGTPVPVTGLSGAPAAGTPGPVDCNHPLNVSAAGRGVRLAVKNQSRGTVSLLLGIGKPNSLGQCGWASVTIPKKSKTVVVVPESQPDLGDWCYWASASISDRGNQALVSGKDFCLISGWHWVMTVSDSGIQLGTH
jgi:hypothetical protein